MQDPFFTIIVPTRNRSDLLPDAINSILHQDFEDFELIVSDNFNERETEDTVHPFLFDERVRLIRTSSLLPMTGHWQFAAEHAVGKYVLFVTDRSVLRKGALSKIHRALQEAETPPELCSWTWTLYHDEGGYEYGDALLVDPLAPPQLLDSVDVARGFTTQPGPYAYILPRGLNSCFLNSMFKNFVINHGTPFLPVSPDYFSAFLFLGFTSKILHIPQPLFVSQGLSVSNGGNGYLGTSEKYLSTLGKIDWMRYVPIKAPLVDNTIFADFLAARDKVGGNLMQVNLSLPHYYYACFQELLAKKGARVLDSYRIREFFSEFERALKLETVEVQQATRALITAQYFPQGMAFLRYTWLGAYLRKAKHWFTRLRAGSSVRSGLTVMEVAGHYSINRKCSDTKR